jgi:predicted nucleic acid-binding protein
MKLIVDANIFLAVVLNEPEKDRIIEKTLGIELISPVILPYEIGNALSAMAKRNRLNRDQIIQSFQYFKEIPVRFVNVTIDSALKISLEHDIYAYDAYYLETAKKLKLQLLTLDQKMKSIAQEMNISLLEVSI